MKISRFPAFGMKTARPGAPKDHCCITLCTPLLQA